MPPSVAIWPGSSIIAVIPIVTQKSLRLTEKAKLSFIPSRPLHMARKLLMITNSPLRMRRLGAFVEQKSAGSISIEKQQQQKKNFQSFRQVFGFLLHFYYMAIINTSFICGFSWIFLFFEFNTI